MKTEVVVIGAGALGPKAACRFKRLEPNSTVTIVDQNALVFHERSGIPFFVSGDVSDIGQLRATSFQMPRDEQFFSGAKDITVMTHTRGLSIDRRQKRVLIENTMDGKKDALSYDKLVLATGGRPKPLSVPGVDLEGVCAPYNLNDAVTVKDSIAGGKVGRALVIGASLMGLQMAEALSDMWGIETGVVEAGDQFLPRMISRNLARMVQHHLEKNGISLYLSQQVERLEGENQVERVVTSEGTIEADLVLIASGVIPNSELAREAGLAVSPTGAVVVNGKMETSDPHIYAGGDCVEITHLITGKPVFCPSDALAHKQGRIIGTNLAGGNRRFEGTVGSFVVKLFEISVAGAGLSQDMAHQEGFDATTAFVVQFDHAHFHPDKDLMYLELVVEKGTGRVLGIQGLGNTGYGTAGRVDAVAAMLKYRPTTADISNLEVAYSPPFSGAMDIVNTLGNVAENVLAGKNRGLDAEAFVDLWEKREKGEAFFLDCRGWANAEPFVKKYPLHWKSIPQETLRDRIGEVPRDKQVVLICNTGMRSYEAQLMLDQAGIKDTRNVSGGIAAMKKWGLDLSVTR